MDATLARTSQDADAQLACAILEIREALRSTYRTKTRIRDLLGRFAEIVQLHDSNSYCCPQSRASGLPGTVLLVELSFEQSTLLENAQSLSLLARSGIETSGWWATLERQFEELVCLLSNRLKMERCCSG